MRRLDRQVCPLQTVTRHLLDAVHQTLPRSEGMIIVATSVKVSVCSNYLHTVVGGEAELVKARQVRVLPLQKVSTLLRVRVPALQNISA